MSVLLVSLFRLRSVILGGRGETMRGKVGEARRGRARLGRAGQGGAGGVGARPQHLLSYCHNRGAAAVLPLSGVALQISPCD